jgi:hypothetical protein
MDTRMPETCWAVFKRQVINLRSCCILLVDSVEITLAGLVVTKSYTPPPHARALTRAHTHTRTTLQALPRFMPTSTISIPTACAVWCTAFVCPCTQHWFSVITLAVSTDSNLGREGCTITYQYSWCVWHLVMLPVLFKTLYTLKHNFIVLHTLLNLHRISELPFYFSKLFGTSSLTSKDTVCYWTPRTYLILDSISCSLFNSRSTTQCLKLMLLLARHATNINLYICREESFEMQAIYRSLIATAVWPQTAHLEVILRLNSTILHQTIPAAHLLAEKYPVRCWLYWPYIFELSCSSTSKWELF